MQAGEVYESYSITEEIEARHRAAGRDPKLGYDNADRDLTEEQKAAFRAEGRRPVFRLRMPDRDITFTDLVRGEITFPAGSVPDLVLVRGDGNPLYTLTNPVDDALMGITHVLRGEDLLPSTPRQIALYEALSGSASAPARRPSGICRWSPARATASSPSATRSRTCSSYRDDGFLTEGMVNYLALLGWSLVATTATSSPPPSWSPASTVTGSRQPGAVRPQEGRGHQCRTSRLLAPDDFARRLEPYLVAELPAAAV